MCDLEYIPERLHSNNRPYLDEFSIGDVLYRRCSVSIEDSPYARISLVDLSHNIGTCRQTQISIDSDVLYSISIEEDFECYPQKIPLRLEIKTLDGNGHYDKDFPDPYNQNNDQVCNMKLAHDPIPCMYPHCEFRLTFEDELVRYANYKQTLGRKSARNIRTSIRTELAKMIIRREIRQ